MDKMATKTGREFEIMRINNVPLFQFEVSLGK